MTSCDIIDADFENPEHREAIPFLLNEYAGDLLGFRKPLEKHVIRNLVPALESFPGTYVVLAKVTDQFVGFAISFLGFSTFKACPLMNVHDIGVLKAYRGKGIGRSMIDHVIQRAISMGCCKITLEVQENNTGARRFYRDSGFSESFLDEKAGRQLFLSKEL